MVDEEEEEEEEEQFEGASTRAPCVWCACRERERESTHYKYVKRECPPLYKEVAVSSLSLVVVVFLLSSRLR